MNLDTYKVLCIWIHFGYQTTHQSKNKQREMPKAMLRSYKHKTWTISSKYGFNRMYLSSKHKANGHTFKLIHYHQARVKKVTETTCASGQSSRTSQ